MRLLLGIETSCDETAAAVVTESLEIRSNVVSSQERLHERFGGVVPELASRAHVERILPVVDEAMRRAGASPRELAAIAVVTGPGLVGSLLIGLTAAKTLALVWDKPLVGVDHISAHLFACRMAAGRDLYPAVGLVISGGHTNLYDCRSASDLELIGSTRDDAVGEAFDKVAAILGLPYPGGPSIEAAARGGDPRAYRFPRAFLKEDRLDFSFSGLKTAVLYEIEGQPPSRRDPNTVTPKVVADVAASFQQAAADVLAAKCRQALVKTRRRTLLVGGGVAANRTVRAELERACTACGAELHLPPPALCTDNAAMAAIAWDDLKAGRLLPLDADAVPGLVRK